MSLPELLERVKAASGPDRELGADLLWVLDHARAQAVFNNAAMGMPRSYPPTLPIPAGLGRLAVRAMGADITASIDAAVALIERTLPGWRWMVRRIYPEDGGGPLFCAYAEQVDGPMFSRTAPTAPLALIIALLEAKIAEDKP
jgi:hypothetical protein